MYIYFLATLLAVSSQHSNITNIHFLSFRILQRLLVCPLMQATWSPNSKAILRVHYLVREPPIVQSGLVVRDSLAASPYFKSDIFIGREGVRN